MGDYVLAIDQGTTSSRAIVFDHDGRIGSTGQQEFEQILPRAGWVEHDPEAIWASVREVVAQARDPRERLLATQQLHRLEQRRRDLAAGHRDSQSRHRAIEPCVDREPCEYACAGSFLAANGLQST